MLKYLDVTNMLDITTILTLEVFHSAVCWVYTRYVWLILNNATKPHRQAFI